MSIATDTPIIPEIIADTVIREARQFCQDHFPAHSALAHLLAKAETAYQRNPRFRRRLRAKSNHGRDSLYAFMRHWLAGWLMEQGTPRHHIPLSWANGECLTPPDPSISARNRPKTA